MKISYKDRRTPESLKSLRVKSIDLVNVAGETLSRYFDK